MNEEEKKKIAVQNQMRHLRFALVVEIIFTLSIAAIVAFNVWSSLFQEAKKTTNETKTDYQAVVQRYTSSFKSITIPIKDKIAQNPSVEEMQTWLQSKEEEFKDAVGENVYDGIAFTYKGKYVHSWSYGNYTNYNPNNRPWYQAAKKANGKVTVVPPYVTYLSTAKIEDDDYILMTIAQRYNEEISFDLDLKVTDIKNMLKDTHLLYSDEKIFIYDADGYILSTTNTEGFAHNVYKNDNVISKGYRKIFSDAKTKNEDSLQLKHVDGHWQYFYFNHDQNGNTSCMIIPFAEVAKKNFLAIGIISILLILFEIYLFLRNKKNAIEFTERDHHLSVVANTIYKERLYVNVDEMDFYGNDTAGNLCKNGTYDELYQLIQSRMADEDEYPKLEEFLSAEVLLNNRDHLYVIDAKRFMMNMKDKDGSMKKKTIEMSRLGFLRNGAYMVAIAMRDAEESADLLKEALETANQASKSKGNFLSNMSHEIRTPLNAMIGYLTIAKDKDCTDEKKDYCIDNCDTASRHLLQIINDILDMSSIESGKLKIAHEEFDLKKELTDITTIFFQNAKSKSIEFETHVEDLTQEWVIGDQLRLNQVLMNLLSNAIKFTQEGGIVQLKVNEIRQDDVRVYMQFTILDNGIGMSEEYMSRIFHPFEQENASTARKFGGSGLGLSITNNLVHMMGGSIDVTSHQGEGTTFIITLFFEKTTQKHEERIQSDYSHVRVLVVDDKKDECTYVKTMLKRCGVKADIATSGEKALKQVQRRMGSDYSYDLCIIDWNMPEMNGGEVTRRIRNELGEDMPIIIATAYDVTEFEEEAHEAGANKIVAKPLFQSTLFDLLVSTFGGYHPKAKETKEEIDMTGMRILLAEDNPMNMDIAVTILEKVGIVVDQALNGKEARDMFLSEKEGTYDLILMDVQMPVMDGYEATKEIRTSSHPEAKSIPIIAMTANAFAEDIAQALSNGMNAHIAKPINYDKLFEVLKKCWTRE